MDADLPAYRSVAPTEPSNMFSKTVVAILRSRVLGEPTLDNLLSILTRYVETELSESRTNPFSKIGVDGMRAFVDRNPNLKLSLEDVLQNQLEQVAKDQLSRIVAFFLNPFPPAPRQPIGPLPVIDDVAISSMAAAELSWMADYIGDVPEALWKYLTRVDAPYPRVASIVQSSGTGKSRAVDEMSKTHFVIPINLRASGTSGYPPPDGDLEALLCRTTGKSQQERYTLFCAFLQALFETTVRALNNGLGLDSGEDQFKDNDQPEEIARKFRKCMSSGMSVKRHGHYREGFYKAVIKATENILAPETSSPTPTGTSKQTKITQNEAQCALQELVDRLLKAVSRSSDLPDPLVIIAFDEAHTLTDAARGIYAPTWSNFVELQRALCHYAYNPSLLTLFLSTACRIDQFAFSRPQDYSARSHHDNLSAYHPFVLLGFDQFAIRLKFDGTEDLDLVTAIQFIASYGRPLWGTIFIWKNSSVYEMKLHIVQFGALKLLGGRDVTSIVNLDGEQKFACLSHRLPIEFKSTSASSRRQEQHQVEGYMRICLRADAGFESMITTSPSEPLLSEAAYYIMQDLEMDCPTALKDILDRFSVHKGDRGEILVLLAQMMARDKAVSQSTRYYGTHGRTCTVPDFLQALFEPQQEAILSAKGMALSTSEGGRDCKILSDSLEATFQATTIYCTHWIKPHQQTIVSTNYLVRLFARGAAVLCGDEYPGIVGVTPYLYNSTKLAASNIGAILWRSTAEEEYGKEPCIDLFTAMDPYSAGLFTNSGDEDEHTVGVPVIRIVFALAAKEPSISIVTDGKSESGRAFTTYDIWVVGLGPKIFGVMDDKSVWEALLDASQGWKDIYRNANPAETDLLMSMNPGVAEDPAFWDYWADEASLVDQD